MLPEVYLFFTCCGEFAGRNQQPFSLGENFRREHRGRYRKHINAMSLSSATKRFKPDLAGVGKMPACNQVVITRRTLIPFQQNEV